MRDDYLKVNQKLLQKDKEVETIKKGLDLKSQENLQFEL